VTARRRLVARSGRDRRKGSNREVRNNLRGASVGVLTAEIGRFGTTKTLLDLVMARSERCEPVAALAGISGGAWPQHALIIPANRSAECLLLAQSGHLSPPSPRSGPLILLAVGSDNQPIRSRIFTTADD
jgi:hypothetical protein